ncbi:MAG: transglutaminase family protein [Hyphomonadaceae bacterium]|nr:transglutaminase family protein [Hyphomonadaceae bacterium]
MRLGIVHETAYRYEAPLERSAQIARLFPRAHAGLEILSWSVTRDGQAALAPFEDGLGNRIAVVCAPRLATGVRIEVRGEVITRDTGGRWNGEETLPPIYFLRETALTRPAGGVGALLERAPGGREEVIEVARLVRGRIDFAADATNVCTPAAEALARGSGVCQDHSHVLIAALRARGVPARYVSGYLWTGRGDEPASHAWVETFTEGEWVGVDPANRCFAGEAHVRLAAGLDYADAAPVTGVRAGGGAEKLSVRVGVQQAQQ